MLAAEILQITAELLDYNLVRILTIGIFGLLCQWTYVAFCGSLRRFPGPFAAKVSSFWLARQCRNTRRSVAVMEQHRRYGDFVRVGPNHISINHPDAAQEIYGHKSGCLKSDFYDAFLQVTPVVFNVRNAESHQRKRKYMNPAFAARALSAFEPSMDAEIRIWKTALLELGASGQKTIDFTVWTNYLAFDVIGRFAFGQSFGFSEKGDDPYNLISTIDTRGEVLNALGSLPIYIRPWMKYHFLDSFWSNGLRATANLERIGRRAYEQRRASGESHKDLLSHLFQAQDSKGAIGEQEIIAESISFIVGGSDTTSSTITNVIDFISRDFPLQQRIQQELDDAFPGTQSEQWIPPDVSLQNLPLLNATLREVMRLRPTSATGLERIVPHGGKVIAGAFFPAGTIVSMPTCGLLKDGRVFSDPDKFQPERWMRKDNKELLEHFLPFSTGPRACIGRNFAWTEILKALAVLFKTFIIKRATTKPTIIREGFFNKAEECKCNVEVRL